MEKRSMTDGHSRSCQDRHWTIAWLPVLTSLSNATWREKKGWKFQETVQSCRWVYSWLQMWQSGLHKFSQQIMSAFITIPRRSNKKPEDVEIGKWWIFFLFGDDATRFRRRLSLVHTTLPLFLTGEWILFLVKMLKKFSLGNYCAQQLHEDFRCRRCLRALPIIY